MFITQIIVRAGLFCWFLFAGFSAFAQPVQIETYAVYFETDQHTLTPESKALLAQIVRHLDTLKGATLAVSGHTDARADNAYNDRLSERRVQSVMQFLEAHTKVGLPTILSQSADGELHPLATNDTPEGMAKNRRVELSIHYPIPVKPETTDVSTTETVQDLYDQLAPAPEKYCIDNTRDTLLRCEKGTVIHIPAFAFSRAKRQSCTELSVVEALSLSDILLQNLSTMSGKRQLETSGMVTIQATDTAGTELSLIDQKRLTLFFPTDSVKTDFIPFSGSRDTTAPHNVNWQTRDSWYTSGGTGGVPLSYWTSCWSLPTPCERCTFLPCRIRRFDEGLAGLFNKEQHRQNRELRQCQRAWRRGGFSRTSPFCQQMQLQWTQWGIQPDSTTFLTLYQQYMEDRGLKTVQEAIDRMRQEQDSVSRIQQELQAVSYNVIQSMQMGMINCDRFLQSGQALTQVLSDQAPDARIDGKLIFKDIRSIMPAYGLSSNKQLFLGFPNIPVKQQAWMLFLKIEDGQPYLFLQEISAGNLPVEVVFRKVTTAEIKAALKRVDRP